MCPRAATSSWLVPPSPTRPASTPEGTDVKSLHISITGQADGRDAGSGAGSLDHPDQTAEDGQRAAEGDARAVPLPDRGGQLDRRARVGRAYRRSGPGPGRHQHVLALEEPVAADAAGGPALAGELVQRGHLDAVGRRPG